jgi:hypothetical protein
MRTGNATTVAGEIMRRQRKELRKKLQPQVQSWEGQANLPERQDDEMLVVDELQRDCG